MYPALPKTVMQAVTLFMSLMQVSLLLNNSGVVLTFA